MLPAKRRLRDVHFSGATVWVDEEADERMVELYSCETMRLMEHYLGEAARARHEGREHRPELYAGNTLEIPKAYRYFQPTNPKNGMPDLGLVFLDPTGGVKAAGPTSFCCATSSAAEKEEYNTGIVGTAQGISEGVDQAIGWKEAT